MQNGSGNQRVIVFDTTLRDGEQAPGASMNLAQKLQVARALSRAGGGRDRGGLSRRLAGRLRGRADGRPHDRGHDGGGLARCEPGRHRPCGEALAPASRRRVHVFLATSPIHRAAQAEDVEGGRAAPGDEQRRVRRDPGARTSSSLPRTPPGPNSEFLAEVVERVIEAGATTINIPDTVGYAVPTQFAELIRLPPAHRARHRPGGAQRPLPRRPGAGGGQQPRGARRPGRGRWSARSTASASAPGTARWRRS